ncbi:sensor domain-containing diguanylate cyclase [Streptomonospora litoralis]|uniref:sensor domain-containing diguanylate cyclase n=1 Tax=Streptomonospora litoralis TaxID=2498135 RepID=UPI003743CDA4
MRAGEIQVAVAEEGAVNRKRLWRRPPDSSTLLAQPRGLIALIAAVVGGAVLFGVCAVACTPIRGAEVATFGALVVCAGLCVEAMRRLGKPSGLTRDLLGAWWLPAILLLPPLYSLLMPVPVYLLLQYRIRRAVVHRRVFNAASVAVSGFAASLLFHSVVAGGWSAGVSLPLEVTEDAVSTVDGALVALACCVVFTVLNNLSVAAAMVLSATGAPWRKLLADREALMVDGVELCAGITAAIVTGLSPLLLAVALPPVLLLQRSLLFEQLQKAARTDPKTGLLNAGTWEAEAGAELARVRGAGQTAAVLIIDIDHFKSVNDTYGHLFGDHVLLGVATTITGQLRRRDVVGRFGGEEFVVLLPGADMAEACRIAERLRLRVGRMEINADGEEVGITVSLGLAVLRVHSDDLIGLLAAADLALYRAKGAGRDRVCLPVVPRPAIPAQLAVVDDDPRSADAHPATSVAASDAAESDR